MLFFSFLFFFFFQAEDGIRDWSVTGVQTCALPISHRGPGRHRQPAVRLRVRGDRSGGAADPARRSGRRARGRGGVDRSEERRVGKECRSRWSADHSKKKEKETSRTKTDERKNGITK